MAFIHAPQAQEMSALAVLDEPVKLFTKFGTVDILFQELDFKERMKNWTRPKWSEASFQELRTQSMRESLQVSLLKLKIGNLTNNFDRI